MEPTTTEVAVNKIIGRGWLIGLPRVNFIASDEELSALARAIAFRLSVTAIEEIGSGVGLAIGDGKHVHLCHSDEAEDVAATIAAMAR
jgi:hypothetical protein